MRSLNSDKFEELKLLSSKYDFILLTESWLTKAKEKLYEIEDFNIHYTHRVNRKGGGVAIYARNEFSCKILQRYTNQHVSACWVLHRPTNSNYNPVLIGVVYHPPNLSKCMKEETMDHLVSSIAEFLTTRHRSSRFIICGDFNDLDTRNISVLFPLKQIVSFATRESNTLDFVFAVIAEYYDNCTKLAPMSTNDHYAISLNPSDCKNTPNYHTIKKGK